LPPQLLQTVNQQLLAAAGQGQLTPQQMQMRAIQQMLQVCAAQWLDLAVKRP
jgi:hypothetical protein